MWELLHLLEHLVGGRPISKHIVGGTLELLILLAVVIGLVRYFRPHLFHRFWNYVRRVPGSRLLGVSFSLGILAILLSQSAFEFGHSFTALIFFLVLNSARVRSLICPDYATSFTTGGRN